MLVNFCSLIWLNTSYSYWNVILCKLTNVYNIHVNINCEYIDIILFKAVRYCIVILYLDILTLKLRTLTYFLVLEFIWCKWDWFYNIELLLSLGMVLLRKDYIYFLQDTLSSRVARHDACGMYTFHIHASFGGALFCQCVYTTLLPTPFIRCFMKAW